MAWTETRSGIIGAEGKRRLTNSAVAAWSIANMRYLRGFIFESLAGHGCVLPRVLWSGEAFQNSAPDKDDGVPHGVSRGMWGSYADRRSVSSTTSDALRERRAGSRGPNSLRATPCRSPAPPRVHFCEFGRPRCVLPSVLWSRGSILKFGPQIKMMAFPR